MTIITAGDVLQAAQHHVLSCHPDLAWSTFPVDLVYADLLYAHSLPCLPPSGRELLCSAPSCVFSSTCTAQLLVHLHRVHGYDTRNLFHVPDLPLGVDMTKGVLTSAFWPLDGVSNARSGRVVKVDVLDTKPIGSLWCGQLKHCQRHMTQSAMCKDKKVLKTLHDLAGDRGWSGSAAHSLQLTDLPVAAGCNVVIRTLSKFHCDPATHRCLAGREVLMVMQCGSQALHGHVCFADHECIQIVAVHAIITRAHTPGHDVCGRVMYSVTKSMTKLELSLPGSARRSLRAQRAATRAEAAKGDILKHLLDCGHPPPQLNMGHLALGEKALRALAHHSKLVTAPTEAGIAPLLARVRGGGLPCVRFAGIIGNDAPFWLRGYAPPGPYVVLISEWAFSILTRSYPDSDLWLAMLSGDGVSKLTKENYDAYDIRTSPPSHLDVLGGGRYPAGSGWRTPWMQSTEVGRKYVTLCTVYMPLHSESVSSMELALRLINVACGYTPTGPGADAVQEDWQGSFNKWIQESGAHCSSHTHYHRRFVFSPAQVLCSDSKPSWMNAHMRIKHEFDLPGDSSYCTQVHWIGDPPHFATNLKRHICNMLSCAPSTLKLVRTQIQWMSACDELFSSVHIHDVRQSVKALCEQLHSITSLSIDHVEKAVLSFFCAKLGGGTTHPQVCGLQLIVCSSIPDSSRVADTFNQAMKSANFASCRTLWGCLDGAAEVDQELCRMLPIARYIQVEESLGLRPFLSSSTRACESLHARMRDIEGTIDATATRLVLSDHIVKESESLALTECDGAKVVLEARLKRLAAFQESSANMEKAVAVDTCDDDDTAQMLVCAWHALVSSSTVYTAEQLRKRMSHAIDELRSGSTQHPSAQQSRKRSRLLKALTRNRFCAVLKEAMTTEQPRVVPKVIIRQRTPDEHLHPCQNVDGQALASCLCMGRSLCFESMDTHEYVTLISACRCTVCKIRMQRHSDVADAFKHHEKHVQLPPKVHVRPADHSQTFQNA